MNPWEKGLWFLTTALTAAVLVKLGFTGLIKIYKLLFLYLATDILCGIVGFSLQYDTNWYGYYYVVAQTLKIVIAAPVVVEIYSLALERTPALSQFVRNSVGGILGAAALIPVIMVLKDESTTQHPYLKAFLSFEQTMEATMAIFLILISIFMMWFPVRMRRNVILYIAGFIVWSLARSAQLHLINQSSGDKRINAVVTSIQLCIVVGCLLLWLTGLKSEGESRTAVVGHLWNRAEAEHLTGQLAAINNSLERLRRR